MKKPGVIFDMDGVLVDSEPLYFAQNLKFFSRYQVTISQAEFEKYVGSSPSWMWQDLKERYHLPEPVEWLIRNEKESFFQTLREAEGLEPMAGIPELLRELQARGVNIGLASSSHRKNIELVLEKTGLRVFFKAIVSGEEVANGKPAPDIFLKAGSLLDVDPEACLVIEDSCHGVTAAKAARMTCVGYRNPHSGQQNLSGADVIIASFSESDRRRISSLVENLCFLGGSKMIEDKRNTGKSGSHR